ncbi:MAG: methionine--tRNA ligase [Parcubacteria group bacterium]|nr:methionine--tRNA ligase [Parcubacteria group bacterium]
MYRYITTTLPYVNAKPHMGFALEIVKADILARFWREEGHEVFFNTGTDEHGLKIFREAEKAGLSPQQYTDEYAEKFKLLKDALNLSYTNFIRTTDAHHMSAAQEFWKRCAGNGDIYKKLYRTKYCIGCELEKTDSELVNGHCPDHPKEEIEIREEENYFFRFSKYQKPLLDLYEARPDFVVPDFRFNEIKAFVMRGLEDFSISRLKSKMPWGVPVPGDKEQVMYVWFDALVNYISAIGWPENEAEFTKWWPGMQIAGKDNLRQQSAMWSAMLLSAGLPPPQTILINGFITSDGQKMSKSLGNVLDPLYFAKEYGIDALRYYLARHVNSFEDSDVTEEKFHDAYNANLANGLGNLAARVMTLAGKYLDEPVTTDAVIEESVKSEYDSHLNKFDFNRAMDVVWKKIGELDRFAQENKPWETIKTNESKAKKDIIYLVSGLAEIARLLVSAMPATAEKIKEAVATNTAPEPLFARK